MGKASTCHRVYIFAEQDDSSAGTADRLRFIIGRTDSLSDAEAVISVLEARYSGGPEGFTFEVRAESDLTQCETLDLDIRLNECIASMFDNEGRRVRPFLEHPRYGKVECHEPFEYELVADAVRASNELRARRDMEARTGGFDATPRKKPTPEGWIWLARACIEYEIPSSTLHDWTRERNGKQRIPKTSVRKDPDTGEKLVEVKTLEAELKRRDRLTPG